MEKDITGLENVGQIAAIIERYQRRESCRGISD